MRRLISFTGITLLALAVSGWSSVFAAAFCPHLTGGGQTQVMQGHPCHGASAVKSQHGEHDSGPMSGMVLMPAAEQYGRHDGDGFSPVGQLTGTCSHCLGQGGPPVTTAGPRESNTQRRDAGAAVEKSTLLLAALALVHAPQFVATQNAPPGAAVRKHLLLGIFLI